MKINWEMLAYGAAGAFALDMFGRPDAAKVNLPVLGRAPTLAAGDPAKPGILEGLFSKKAQ